MSRHVLKQIRQAAKRHPKNVAVQRLIKRLDYACEKLSAYGPSPTITNPLYKVERGLLEEKDHDLLLGFDPQILSPLMTRAFDLHEITIIIDCLLCVLEALREQID